MHYLPIYRSIHPIIHTIAKQRTEESANEPANEPTNEPANQPTTNQPSNQRTNKPTNQQTRSNQQTKNQRTNHRIHLQMYQEFSPDLGLPQLQLHWRPRHGEATWFFLRLWWCWAKKWLRGNGVMAMEATTNQGLAIFYEQWFSMEILPSKMIKYERF